MINWTDTDHVLLDMDGTILDLHFDNHFWLSHLPRRFSETKGVSLQTAKDTVMRLTAEVKGKLEWYCLDYWAHTLGIDIHRAKREVAHMIRFRPKSEAFLAALKRKNVRVLIVTNAHRGSVQLKNVLTGIETLVEDVISSHDYGAPKESLRFWQHFQAQYAFEPARAVFVDDSEPVLDAAANFGIGQIFQVSQPDGTQAMRTALKYPSVNFLDELLAETRTT